MHLSICNIIIPLPPRHTPGHLNLFYFQRSNSPPPGPKCCSNALHVRPVGWTNAPALGHFFRHLTGQDRFKTAPPRFHVIRDGEDVPTAKRQTAQQKFNFLELIFAQIANYCPVISRNTLVKNSTSIQFIWNRIREHFGFQVTGAHFLDFANFHLETDERPEDLYQSLMAFVEDTLLRANSLSHHGEPTPEDEKLTPTLENFIVLSWLRLIHPELPKLVKQRYGTELRSRTLASIKPEISQALTSLLDEIRAADDAKIMRTAVSSYRKPIGARAP